MELKTYNQEGKEIGKIKLDDGIFDLPWNADLVHQIIISMQSNKRVTLAQAKTRAEVRGGGAKPWRQKGTGRARHGSRRSPIWVGGGVTHGPLKEKDYSKKINKKMKKKALFVVLSQKTRDKEIIVLDSLKAISPSGASSLKTKEANNIILNLSKIKDFEKLATKKKNRAEILVKTKGEGLKKAFSNLPGILLEEARNLNPLDVLTYKYLIFTQDAVNSIK